MILIVTEYHHDDPRMGRLLITVVSRVYVGVMAILHDMVWYGMVWVVCIS